MTTQCARNVKLLRRLTETMTVMVGCRGTVAELRCSDFATSATVDSALFNVKELPPDQLANNLAFSTDT